MRVQVIDGVVFNSNNDILPGKKIHGFGTVTMEWPGIAPSRDSCIGCRDDRYNHTGEHGCWYFPSAVVCNKVGYSSINVAHGPDTHLLNTLSCWHGDSK